MASGLTGKIGPLTSTLTIGASKTDTEVGNIVRLAVADKVTPPPDGQTTAQLGQYYLDALMAELKRYIMQEAQKNLIRERAAQEQAIRDQAATDTAI